MAYDIQLKRAYVAAQPDDGVRVLVERLWPRGVARDRAAIERWFKELAPSDQLRKWYAHEPERWPEFQVAYRAELERAEPNLMEELTELCRNGRVTFVYAAKDEERNSARLLRDFLLARL